MFGARCGPDAFGSLRGRVLNLENQQGKFAPRVGSLEHHIQALDTLAHDLEARMSRQQQRWQMLYGDEEPPELAPSLQTVTRPPGVAEHDEVQAASLPAPSAPTQSLTAQLAEEAPLFTGDASSRHGSLEQYLALAEVRSVQEP